MTRMNAQIKAADALHEVLSRTRQALRPESFHRLPEDDQRVLAAEAVEALALEVRAAYAEQMAKWGRAPNYRLSIDDVRFADRLARYLRARADLALWYAEPENRAAQAIIESLADPHDMPNVPDEIKVRIAARPFLGEPVRFSDAPSGWPNRLVNHSWTDTLSWIIAARRESAGVREPGEDSSEAVG